MNDPACLPACLHVQSPREVLDYLFCTDIQEKRQLSAAKEIQHNHLMCIQRKWYTDERRGGICNSRLWLAKSTEELSLDRKKNGAEVSIRAEPSIYKKKKIKIRKFEENWFETSSPVHFISVVVTDATSAQVLLLSHHLLPKYLRTCLGAFLGHRPLSVPKNLVFSSQSVLFVLWLQEKFSPNCTLGLLVSASSNIERNRTGGTTWVHGCRAAQVKGRLPNDAMVKFADEEEESGRWPAIISLNAGRAGAQVPKLCPSQRRRSGCMSWKQSKKKKKAVCLVLRHLHTARALAWTKLSGCAGLCFHAYVYVCICNFRDAVSIAAIVTPFEVWSWPCSLFSESSSGFMCR